MLRHLFHLQGSVSHLTNRGQSLPYKEHDTFLARQWSIICTTVWLVFWKRRTSSLLTSDCASAIWLIFDKVTTMNFMAENKSSGPSHIETLPQRTVSPKVRGTLGLRSEKDFLPFLWTFFHLVQSWVEGCKRTSAIPGKKSISNNMCSSWQKIWGSKTNLAHLSTLIWSEELWPNNNSTKRSPWTFLPRFSRIGHHSSVFLWRSGELLSV